jgi:hypothetical protein
MHYKAMTNERKSKQAAIHMEFFELMAWMRQRRLRDNDPDQTVKQFEKRAKKIVKDYQNKYAKP